MKAILTTTVRVKSEVSEFLPVKSDKPIEKDKIAKAMKRIARVSVKAPVEMGDIIIKNFTEKGINLISTKTLEK